MIRGKEGKYIAVSIYQLVIKEELVGNLGDNC